MFHCYQYFSIWKTFFYREQGFEVASLSASYILIGSKRREKKLFDLNIITLFIV